MLKSSWKNKPADKTRIGAATIEFKLDDEDFGADLVASGTDDIEADDGEKLPDFELELKNADFYEVHDEEDYFADSATEDEELVLETEEPDADVEFSAGEDVELDDINISNIAIYDNAYSQELTDEETELYDEVYETDEIGLEGQAATYLDPYDDELTAEDFYDDSLTYRAESDEGNFTEDVDSRYDEDATLAVTDDGDDAEYMVADEIYEYVETNEDTYIVSDENILALENPLSRTSVSQGFTSTAVAPVAVADYHADDELDAFDLDSEFDFDFDSEFDLDIDFNINFDLSDNPVAEIKIPVNTFEDETAPVTHDAYLLSGEPVPPSADAGFPVKNRSIVEELLPIDTVDDATLLGTADVDEALTAEIVLDGLDFAADAPIEIIAYEEADGTVFAGDEEYLGGVEDSMALEEAEMLEEINLLADNAGLEDVEVLEEELEDAEPVNTDNSFAAEELLEPQEAGPLPDINLGVDETKPETAQNPLSEIQRQAEINQQRITEMLSHTTKVTATSLSLPHSAHNRRQHNRVKASILVSYVSTNDDGDSSQGMGVVLDISISGLQLHTPRELTGSHVKLYATDFNDNIMEITGTICQTHRENDVFLNGISFDSAENDTIKFITNLVRIFNARKYTNPGE